MLLNQRNICQRPTLIVIIVPKRPMAFAVRPSNILSKATPKPREAVRSFPLMNLLMAECRKPTLHKVELCILINSLIGYPHHSSEASGRVSSTFPTMVVYVAGPTATAC